ncbi:hypothetical protein LG3211_0725 [Lysobacter gummosus]|nr:hypothetical protein LG3211_0725 [Lysobacter gummosus]
MQRCSTRGLRDIAIDKRWRRAFTASQSRAMPPVSTSPQWPGKRPLVSRRSCARDRIAREALNLRSSM